MYKYFIRNMLLHNAVWIIWQSVLQRLISSLLLVPHSPSETALQVCWSYARKLKNSWISELPPFSLTLGSNSGTLEDLAGLQGIATAPSASFGSPLCTNVHLMLWLQAPILRASWNGIWNHCNVFFWHSGMSQILVHLIKKNVSMALVV